LPKLPEESVAVEFRIRITDLRLAASQLKVNRGEYRESDTVDILVSECAATFRAVGTETEVPVEGEHPGSVRLSLKSLQNINKVALSFKKKQARLKFEPGTVWIETFSQTHPDIELGKIPDQQLQIPLDVSVLDTLALAEILGPDGVVQEGLRARVEDAIRTRTFAVSQALEVLRPLEINESQLQRLIDDHITLAAAQLRQTLRLSQ
jgi:hypothetical protein